MKIKTAVSLAMGLAAVFFTMQAHATTCDPGIGAATMGNKQTGVVQAADDCQGPLSNADLKNKFGNNYDFDIKNPPNTGSESTVPFDLFGNTGSLTLDAGEYDHHNGTWSLSWTVDTNVTADLYVVVKSDSEYAVFEFTQLAFSAPGGAYDDNIWTVSFDPTHWNNVSYLALIIENVTPTTNAVPEPATMLLFGTGLLGLAGISRRKR